MGILTPFVFISCGIMWWMMADDYEYPSKILLRAISLICFILGIALLISQLI